MSRWLSQRRKDQFYRLAKQKGYRSRAAFKLLQVVRSHGLIKPGYIVVDLGAAPGGWLQAARSVVGEAGFVLGIDVEPIDPLPFKNVALIRVDIASPEAPDMIKNSLGVKADVVLADLSPKITGVWEVDSSRQIFLASKGLEIARTILRRNGKIFFKVFQGTETSAFLNSLRDYFEKVKMMKPKASRAESSELYVLGIGFRGTS